MAQERKSTVGSPVPEVGSVRVRPLSARSVIASTLLGMDPPRLPGRLLVRSGELFGHREGATRTAISRMVASGELTAGDGSYHLAGPLLHRHARQQASRAAVQRSWSGTWVLAVATGERRTASERSELRTALGRLGLAPWRDGVWARPDNLPPDRSPDASAVADARCTWVRGHPEADPVALAAQLWDLPAWARDADDLAGQLRSLRPRLDDGALEALAPAFVVAAATLRHLVADPLLPTELQPADWPGPELRDTYDRFQGSFSALWRDWFRRQAP
ncbi:MAG: hypothetical protein MUF83_10735 [Acidimicrobiales bacterium]|jgi:phenylacetic acid degradation operon negative regulatory protein|nr:hypothetical protein [Acidimicrobiales bacterium]